MRKKSGVIALIAVALLAIFFLTFYMHETNKEKALSQFNDAQLQIARQTALQIVSYLRSRSHDLQRLASSAALQAPERKRITDDIQSNFEHLKTIHIRRISLREKMIDTPDDSSYTSRT